ncbi:MAG: TldD/PmbA family protein [Nannocystales bacterium]
MPNTLLDGAELAVALAQEGGADGAFASMSRSRQVSLEVRDQELEKVQESTDTSLRLQVYVDGRYSVHGTNDLSPDALQVFVDEAVALTRALEVDAYRELPDPARYAHTQPALDLRDPAVESQSLEARLERAMALNARLAGKDKVISATASVFDGSGESGAVSSNGFAASYRSTSTGMHGNVTLRGEGDKRPEDGWGMYARHLATLQSPASIGDEAMRRARLRLGSKKGPTTKTTMVVSRDAAASLIVRLIGPASGGAVQQGRSMWAGKLGQQLVSEKLDIVSNPLIPGAVGSHPFDDEGAAAFEMPIIKNGALQHYFLNSYYARKLDTKPTTGRWGNIIVRPGKRDLDAIVSDVGTGVYVTSWLGGNADSTTGDFSFGLRGHLIEGGRVGAPVGEMNVTGNLLALFTDLQEVGSDPYEHSTLRVPTLVFRDVQFSGT